MSQERLLQLVTSVMLSAELEVSERCMMRPRSFDLIAGGPRGLLVIKVVAHIDSISEDLAYDLDQIAVHLNAVPLIVGEKARDNNLERGVVYLRYGIYAVNPATLHDCFCEGIPPLVYSSPGGLYVNINKEKMRELREYYKLSLGELAHLLGVSRRTISKYEGGMNTTLEVAVRLEELFDTELVEPIELMSYNSRFDNISSFSQHPEDKTGIAGLEGIGVKIHLMRRAPFNALALLDNEIILTAYGPANKTIKRAEIMGNISQVTKTHAMCIISDYEKERRIGSTLVVGEKSIRSLRDPEDLMHLINN